MDQGSGIASFTGVLLKRERTSEHNLVRLLFRENDKNILCVSTNPQDASCQVGQSYKVEGTMAEKRGHAFITDPRITLTKKHWSLIRRAGIGVVALAILGTGGTVFALRIQNVGAPVQLPVAPAVTHTAKPAPTPAPAAAATPTPTPTVTPTVKKTTTAKTTAAKTVSKTTSPVTSAAVAPPVTTTTNEDQTAAQPADNSGGDTSTQPPAADTTPPADDTTTP